jgi:hypothetical protein
LEDVPSPSMVSTCEPCTPIRGMRQALIERYRGLRGVDDVDVDVEADELEVMAETGSSSPMTTVQAPQPPSLHPNFVPVNPCARMNSNNVNSGSGFSS